jgi:hypothetical protein
MNRWKILCLILLCWSVALGFAAITSMIHRKSSDAALDKYIAADAARKHFKPGTFKAPEIPDAPVGSRPLFTAEGSVTFPATRGASRREPAMPSSTTTAPSGGSPVRPPLLEPAPEAGCSLDEVELTVRCRLDGIAAPGAPYGRLTASGRMVGFGLVRDLPPTPAGDLELRVAPWLDPSTWHLDLLGGAAAGERIGFEFGATWTGRSRWGPYVMAEWQPAVSGDLIYTGETYLETGARPATWRVHAGARFRVK